MSSPVTTSNKALDTLVSVQQILTETISLLDTRADSLVEDSATLTEQRALLNTVKGIKSLVETQLRAAGGIK